jgi:hypothetical protein
VLAFLREQESQNIKVEDWLFKTETQNICSAWSCFGERQKSRTYISILSYFDFETDKQNILAIFIIFLTAADKQNMHLVAAVLDRRTAHLHAVSGFWKSQKMEHQQDVCAFWQKRTEKTWFSWDPLFEQKEV